VKAEAALFGAGDGAVAWLNASVGSSRQTAIEANNMRVRRPDKTLIALSIFKAQSYAHLFARSLGTHNCKKTGVLAKSDYTAATE